MISATIQKAAETISRLDALRKKMAVSAYLKKTKTARHNRARIKERKAAERLIEKALQPFFVDQIESAAKALAATVAPEGTKVFCPTGPGGGVDATCKPGGGAAPKTASVALDSFASLITRHPPSEYTPGWFVGPNGASGIEYSGIAEAGSATVRVFRVGAIDQYKRRGGVFFAGDDQSLKPYQSLHEGKQIEEYEFNLKNVLVAGHQTDITKAWFKKSYGELQNFYHSKYGSQGADVANSKFDKKIFDEAKKRGYDAIVYLSPAPPAKTELGIVGDPKSKIVEKTKKYTPTETKSTQQTLPSIFNPNDWNQKLVDTLYPAMVKIAVVGMDGEMRRMGLQIKRGFASVKSTATDFLSGLDDSGGLLDVGVLDTPYGPVNMAFLFDYPDWMKQAIAEFLKESFEQPYWEELNKTTLGDIEKYLQEGIKEGWSIEKMATEMAPQLLETGRYAKLRGRRIARTEAGHALNGARSMGIDSVIAELQGTGLDIRKLWNSVLGTTTRDTHRKIHGVPADKDGTWSLGGVRCRWPGDVVLPANERIHCQCTLETSFGMTDEEAQELIQLYEGRMAKASWAELRVKVWESTKCGGPGGTPGPCPTNKPETKPARKPRKPKEEKPKEEELDAAVQKLEAATKPEKKSSEFKKFKNGNEAEAALAGSAKQWMDGPADDYFANKGVKAYAGTSESFRINDCLRQKCGDKGLDTKASELKSVIDKASFPESVESHRSINPKTPEERASILSFFEKRVGQTFVDSAFVSTTANKAYAKTWSKGAKAEPISISVHVKKGSKAIYIPKDITGRQEWEVLIQSGSKFRVKSVEGSSVVMELDNE